MQLSNIKMSKYLKGIAFLASAVSLLLIASTLTMLSAKTGLLQEKIQANTQYSAKAFEAAEAGLEYGLSYLKKNISLIKQEIATNNSYQTTKAFNNGENQTTINFTNPDSLKPTFFQITSTGTSDQGTAKKTVSQLVRYVSILASIPSTPLLAKGEVELSGNLLIFNPEGLITIWSGDTTEFKSGSAMTQNVNGTTSRRNDINEDIRDNSPVLQNMTQQQFMQNIFEKSMDSLKESADVVLSGQNNYSQALNGRKNQFIWIDAPHGKATINGNAVLGSPEEPVILFVNGDLAIKGGAIIYGFVFVKGEVDDAGNATIIGSIAASDEFEAKGTFNITYNSAILNRAERNFGKVAKLPGSWHDF